MFEDLFLRNKDYALKLIMEEADYDTQLSILYLQQVFMLDRKTVETYITEIENYIDYRYQWRIIKTVLIIGFYTFLVVAVLHYIMTYTHDFFLTVYSLIFTVLIFLWVIVSVIERISEHRRIRRLFEKVFSDEFIPINLDTTTNINNQTIIENPIFTQTNNEDEQIIINIETHQ